MKRTLLLAALFILLGAGAYYALVVKKNQNQSHVSWDMDFTVANTDEIQKIFLADRKGQKATLLRKGDHWEYNGRFKARPTGIESLLETMRKQIVWYIPTDAAKPNLIKSLATEGIKVEVYGKNDQKIKAFYVGGVTPDERGTYMIMEGAEQPYVVHIPSFTGQLRVRYLLREDDWRDRAVFSEKPESIQFVSVEYPQQKSESFKLTRIGKNEYDVQPFYSTTPKIKQALRKGAPDAYVVQFESLIAEGLETDYYQRDSIHQLVPFAIIKLQRDNGEERTVRFWPGGVEYRKDNDKPFVTRFFAETSDSSFYLVQDHVFGPIFRGYGYFFEAPDKRRMAN
jgi:hypothetical protein